MVTPPPPLFYAMEIYSPNPALGAYVNNGRHLSEKKNKKNYVVRFRLYGGPVAALPAGVSDGRPGPTLPLPAFPGLQAVGRGESLQRLVSPLISLHVFPLTNILLSESPLQTGTVYYWMWYKR